MVACVTRTPTSHLAAFPSSPKLLSLGKQEEGWNKANEARRARLDSRPGNTWKGCIPLCCAFLYRLEVPSPQPNVEIRKPSMKLMLTLISVTICSLIFFICKLQSVYVDRTRVATLTFLWRFTSLFQVFVAPRRLQKSNFHRFSSSGSWLWRECVILWWRSSTKFGTLHEFACHPCAGAMLIFSVSFQF